MIIHYFTLAVRNLLNYKTQSIVSVLGLAVGLTCFALSAFWIRYEMTYDTFHRDAERLYYVRMDNLLSLQKGFRETHMPYPLAAYLKENHREIEQVACFRTVEVHVLDEEKRMANLSILIPDSCFMEMMEIKVTEGDNGFHLQSAEQHTTPIALTEAIAIRKVNGAKARDILLLFLREYLLITLLAAVVALPVAYVIMQQWIEHYTRQVDIGVLTFILIFAAVAGVVVASIAHRTWQAARQNPAEVIKRE